MEIFPGALGELGSLAVREVHFNSKTNRQETEERQERQKEITLAFLVNLASWR